MTDMPEKKIIKLDDEKIKKAAAEERERQRKLGHGDDGNLMVLEMDQSSGAQTLISAPNLSIPIKEEDGTQAMDTESGEPMYQWQALIFAHPQQALEWIKERGEKGFSYMVLKAIEAVKGTKTEEELLELAESDAASMQEAVERDQEDRRP